MKKKLCSICSSLLPFIFFCSKAAPLPPLKYPGDLSFEHTYMMYKSYEAGGYLFPKLFKAETAQGTEQVFNPRETFEVTTHEAIKKLEEKLSSSGDTSYTALRITYGLKPDEQDQSRYRIVFIYVPVLMKLSGRSPDLDTFTAYPAYYSTQEDQNLYLLRNGAFVHLGSSQEIADAHEWINNYKRFIRIDEGNSNHFRHHNQLETIEGDGTSETFAFGEIDHFFHTSDSVYISSWANIALVHGLYTFKHFIAFANAPYTHVTEGRTLAADLGTMCPPNCLVTKVQAGRIQACKLNFADYLKNNKETESNNSGIWILLVGLGCLLTGFITSRLFKK